MRRRFLSILFVILGSMALAVQPDEVLDDPALEARAREISQLLRCVVCQNETIDESNAPVARDLRLLVRDRLVQGDSNDDVLAYVVERYGEFALLKPKSSGANMVLWWGGPIMALLSLLVVIVFFRESRTAIPEPVGLSRDEEDELNRILDEQPNGGDDGAQR